MVECDHCGDDVFHVWRRRERAETMTHRTVVWVCRNCHPELGATGKTDASATRAVTDGRRLGKSG
ncbi:hypothetical protein ACFQMA_00645 [Halosimplex aquaticum]|uniref:Small CPxCG-related zinc finger protein n=1 Tax=Halosimplex aquaticum TaxID=3026162 RepID=A0ABD5XTB5_9EURY|nr:hypothetical protein [Halosimplex aquaticum]